MSRTETESDNSTLQSNANWFVRRGFCFRVLPRVESGVFTLDLEFQNCYSNPADVLVLLHLPGTSLRISRHFTANGGESGLRGIRLGVPKRYQGQTDEFRVYADVEFPSEPGELLQTMEAKPVNGTPGVGLEILRNVFGALAGTVALRKETTLSLALPNDVATTVEGNTAPQEALAHPIIQYSLLTALIGVMLFGLLMILFPGIFG